MLNHDKTRPPAGERRGCARVHDAVGLHLQRLEDMPAAGEARRKGEQSADFRKPNKYDIAGYAEVKRDYPAVSDYIAELEERVRQLLLDGDQPAQTPTHKVSLSTTGLAFSDDMLLYPGELVGITLTLFPGLQRIASDAWVLSANDGSVVAVGDKPHYRIAFVRMTDTDRDILDTHVAQLIDSLPTSSD